MEPRLTVREAWQPTMFCGRGLRRQRPCWVLSKALYSAPLPLHGVSLQGGGGDLRRKCSPHPHAPQVAPSSEGGIAAHHRMF